MGSSHQSRKRRPQQKNAPKTRTGDLQKAMDLPCERSINTWKATRGPWCPRKSYKERQWDTILHLAGWQCLLTLRDGAHVGFNWYELWKGLCQGPAMTMTPCNRETPPLGTFPREITLMRVCACACVFVRVPACTSAVGMEVPFLVATIGSNFIGNQEESGLPRFVHPCGLNSVPQKR